MSNPSSPEDIDNMTPEELEELMAEFDMAIDAFWQARAREESLDYDTMTAVIDGQHDHAHNVRVFM